MFHIAQHQAEHGSGPTPDQHLRCIAVPLKAARHWLISPNPKVSIGTLAGRAVSTGYIQIGIRGRHHLAHRLAWLVTHGAWPTQQIDHINRDAADNRICNLRDVSPSANQRNKNKQATGVCFHKKTGKWMAQIVLPVKRKKYLGLYETREKARAAFEAARSQEELRMLG